MMEKDVKNIKIGLKLVVAAGIGLGLAAVSAWAMPVFSSLLGHRHL
jgi:hypothetical protein